MQIRSPRSVLAVSAALALTAAAIVPLSAFAKGPGPGPGPGPGLGAGSFGVASGAAQRGRAEDRPRGPEACAECQYEMGTLTEAQIAAVQYMANEEKLAHDVYTKFAELYDVPVFERIASAEAQHETAVDFIVERYEIVDSPRGLGLGVFTNDEISALYDTLVAQGSEDLESALAASVLVEETDIGDLKAAMGGLEEAAPDAYHVFSNLLAGSERHLVTFQSYL